MTARLQGTIRSVRLGAASLTNGARVTCDGHVCTAKTAVARVSERCPRAGISARGMSFPLGCEESESPHSRQLRRIPRDGVKRLVRKVSAGRHGPWLAEPRKMLSSSRSPRVHVRKTLGERLVVAFEDGGSVADQGLGAIPVEFLTRGHRRVHGWLSLRTLPQLVYTAVVPHLRCWRLWSWIMMF